MLESSGQSPKKAVVVLGTPIAEDTDLRIAKAVTFLNKCQDCIMLLVGTESEAGLMRRAALARGVDARIIVADGNSRTTIDNAYYAKRVCMSLRIKEVRLVTSKYHIERARLTFQRVLGAGYLLLECPCEDSENRTMIEREKAIFPFASLIEALAYGNHEQIKNINDVLFGLVGGLTDGLRLEGRSEAIEINRAPTSSQI
jgi:hypothetical protein